MSSSDDKANYALAKLIARLPFLNEVDPDGCRVFLRADFNAPMDENGFMADDGRLRALLPTINYLLDRGAAVIVGSHLRDPLNDGPQHPDTRFSLAPLARRLSRIWGVDVCFSPEVIGPQVEAKVKELKPGQILLLENLRFHPGEQADDQEFARQLAELADIYVNDAFGVCHREHASISSVPRYVKKAVAGFALKNELMALNRALSSPAQPMAAVIGGENIVDKLPVVKNFLSLADYVFLGGLLGDVFARLYFGNKNMLPPEVPETLAEEALEIVLKRNVYKAKLFVPVDAVALAEGEALAATYPIQELTPLISAKDIGPATRLLYRQTMAQCFTIIWSGPMGVFEVPAFSRGTSCVTRAMAECQGVTLAGGADTSTAIIRMLDRSQISFISSGGSAFLRTLGGQQLVGINALLETAKS